MHIRTIILWILLLCFGGFINVGAQQQNYATFFVTITNSSYEPTVANDPNGGVTVSFGNQILDSISGQYNFRQFHRAYPNTLNSALTDVFIVEVTSAYYMYELKEYDSTIFADVHEANFRKYYLTIGNPNDTPEYSYNNYVSTVTFPSNPALNDIAVNYSFNGFHRAFPVAAGSTDRYIVGVNSPDFLTDVAALGTGIFSAVEEFRPARFRIYITNPDYVPLMQMNFNFQSFAYVADVGLQAILNQYNITECRQLFPNSHFLDLKQLYYIECNDIQLMSDLLGYNSSIFPDAKEFIPTVPQLTPDDYGANLNTLFASSNTHHKYLELIRARDAWNITTGSDTVKIGVSEMYVNAWHTEIKPITQNNNVIYSKIREVYNNTPTSDRIWPGKEDHGAAVVGVLAGYTNNTEGLSSIGWGLRVGLRTRDTLCSTCESDLLAFAKDRYRVANVSWSSGQSACRLFNADPTNNSFYLANLGDETVYDEMYQDGMAVIAAASNGEALVQGTHPTLCSYTSYRFPASFDNVISVTSVGSNVSMDTVIANPTIGYSSIEDVHDAYGFYNNPGATNIQQIPPLTHNNNPRVDICAPGYSVHILTYDKSNPTSKNSKYLANAAGTSLATPLVSGTAGLMLSVNPCLTPFQIEYLLKKAAVDSIYNNPFNQKYANSKQLGAGRLDAYESVFQASGFNCNNPPADARTMYIEEIKINTRCWFTQTATLTPVVKDGNGTYTYRWKGLPGNNVILNNEYIANPTVSSAALGTAGDTLFFLLTVTEANTDIPRVAKKRIFVVRKTSGWDLAMRDAFGDKYNEPNNMDSIDDRDWNFWNSPDIWNNMNSTPGDTPHFNPEYATTVNNYMHVRVKNVGCTASPASTAELRTYWTMASTGEKWPGDWTSNTMSGPNGTVPTGKEITNSTLNPNKIYVPALGVGQEHIFAIPWNPPNPADYGGTNQNPPAICLLARILDNQTSPYGLNEKTTPPDAGALKYNLRHNNNIVTRNLHLFNFDPFNRVAWTRAWFTNGTAQQQTSVLQMLSYRDVHRNLGGDLSAYIYGVVHLGDLYDIWVNGGSQGNATVLDANAKTVLYDPATPLRLENMVLSANQSIPIDIEFKLRDNITVPSAIENALVHFRHIENVTVSIGEEEYTYEETVGGISFAINIDTMTDTSGQSKPGRPTSTEVLISTEQFVKVYPNPAKDYVMFEYNVPGDNSLLKLSISNIAGQEIETISLSNNNKGNTRWTTGNNPPGVYLYKLYNGNTAIDVGRIVITK